MNDKTGEQTCITPLWGFWGGTHGYRPMKGKPLLSVHYIKRRSYIASIDTSNIINYKDNHGIAPIWWVD